MERFKDFGGSKIKNGRISRNFGNAPVEDFDYNQVAGHALNSC